MPRVRRTRYLFFYCGDRHLLDIGQLLGGVARTTAVPQLHAISILRGQEYELTEDELAALVEIPTRWVEIDDLPDAPASLVADFARRGLVVTDAPAGDEAELRRRDDALAAGQWNIYGALYHSLTRWRDVDVPFADIVGSEEEVIGGAVEQFAELHGPPPPHFHHAPHATDVHELPLVERHGGLYDALAKRRTARVFEEHRPLTGDELATLLYYVYGVHGYSRVTGDIVGLRKTSPSGGGLHPLEVYPLLVDVDGYASGLYHYAAGAHSLELVSELEPAEAAEAARFLTGGQAYFANAAALFFLTARFYRSFWKYRRHEKAYGVVLMDAGHLSQTFYLVCAELGLGAFVTSAINSGNLDDRLGIDGFTEGAIAVNGCGRAVARSSYLQPRFVRYVPRETRI